MRKATIVLGFLLLSGVVSARITIGNSNGGAEAGGPLDGGDASSIVFLDSSSNIDTTSTFLFQPSSGLNLLTLAGSGSWGSGQVGVNYLGTHSLDVANNEIHFNFYANAINTGSTVNTANAAHFGGGVFRSSDTSAGATDHISLEGRTDFRSLQANVEAVSVLSYCDWVTTTTAGANTFCAANRIRAWQTTNGSSGSPATSGILYGQLIEDIIGGASTSRAFYQQGTDDFVVFMASVTSFGEATTMLNNKIQIVQAGGADIRPGIANLSGGASSDYLMSFGATSNHESDIIRVGAANSWAFGTASGDLLTGISSTAGKLVYTVGFSTNPEMVISNNAITMRGADNSTVLTTSITVAQASITASDKYISFASNTGEEGNVVGTAVAGVIAFNTFTGGHWTRVFGLNTAKEINDAVLKLVESTGASLKTINHKIVNDNVPGGKVVKSQLVRGRLCTTRGSKAVMGFYAGRNDQDGKDTVLALGTGLAWVVNKGMDVENGDLLMSSDVEGDVEIQDADLSTMETERDDTIRSITVAKARQPIKWAAGEKRRKIAVVYTCG